MKTVTPFIHHLDKQVAVLPERGPVDGRQVSPDESQNERTRRTQRESINKLSDNMAEKYPQRSSIAGEAIRSPHAGTMSVNHPMRTFVQNISTLQPATVEAMYQLHARHFDNDDRARFCADLAAKQWVVLVQSPDGAVKGFSTIQELELADDKGPVRFMFSGDTIVDPSAWASNALAPGIARFITWFMERGSGTPCYWFLICKGYRTYRCLPLFFRSFLPSSQGTAHPDEIHLLELAARYKFGQRYNAETGIISYDQPLDYLNTALRCIPGRRTNDPHVAFFMKHNPGWARGDELACLAKLSSDNLLPSARRVIQAGMRSVQWNI